MGWGQRQVRWVCACVCVCVWGGGGLTGDGWRGVSPTAGVKVLDF